MVLTLHLRLHQQLAGANKRIRFSQFMRQGRSVAVPFASGSLTHCNHRHGSPARYRLPILFSHADLVRELPEVFAPPGVTELLEYATLRPEPRTFFTPAMKKREEDVVWSIELQGQRIYLYLLLEFQSAVDPGIPVRMTQ